MTRIPGGESEGEEIQQNPTLTPVSMQILSHRPSRQRNNSQPHLVKMGVCTPSFNLNQSPRKIRPMKQSIKGEIVEIVTYVLEVLAILKTQNQYLQCLSQSGQLPTSRANLQLRMEGLTAWMDFHNFWWPLCHNHSTVTLQFTPHSQCSSKASLYLMKNINSQMQEV